MKTLEEIEQLSNLASGTDRFWVFAKMREEETFPPHRVMDEMAKQPNPPVHFSKTVAITQMFLLDHDGERE